MSKTRTGELAMTHARAWARIIHPGSLLIEAKPQIKRVPDGHGGKLARNVREDIWGVFDLLVFPAGDYVDCVQVTTGMGGVSKRKKKVARWIEDSIPKLWVGCRPTWLGGVYVITWIRRKHFRVWRWDFLKSAWTELPNAPAPLPPVGAKTRAYLPGEVDSEQVFD